MGQASSPCRALTLSYTDSRDVSPQLFQKKSGRNGPFSETFSTGSGSVISVSEVPATNKSTTSENHKRRRLIASNSMHPLICVIFKAGECVKT